MFLPTYHFYKDTTSHWNCTLQKNIKDNKNCCWSNKEINLLESQSKTNCSTNSRTKKYYFYTTTMKRFPSRGMVILHHSNTIVSAVYKVNTDEDLSIQSKQNVACINAIDAYIIWSSTSIPTYITQDLENKDNPHTIEQSIVYNHTSVIIVILHMSPIFIYY